MSTPTARTPEHIRRLGHEADMVERRAFLPTLRDYLGCIDLIAVRAGEPPLGMQATSATNVAASLANRRRAGETRFTEKLNTPVQGTGADGLKLALALQWERRADCPGAFPVLVVHDELVVERDEAQADAVKVALATPAGPVARDGLWSRDTLRPWPRPSRWRTGERSSPKPWPMRKTATRRPGSGCRSTCWGTNRSPSPN